MKRSKIFLCLAICLVLVLSLEGCQNFQLSFMATPTQPWPTSAYTAIPEPTSTPTPTETPEPTVVPFKQFSGSGFTIMLPETFFGGSLSTNLNAIVQKIKEMGLDEADTITSLKKDKNSASFFAFDTRVGKNNDLINISVMKQSTSTQVPMDVLMKAIQDKFFATCKGCSLDLTKTLDVNGHPGGRIDITSPTPKFDTKQSLYIVEEKKAVWLVVFTVGKGSYKEYKPLFEKSIQTFTLE